MITHAHPALKEDIVVALVQALAHKNGERSIVVPAMDRVVDLIGFNCNRRYLPNSYRQSLNLGLLFPCILIVAASS